MRYEQISIFPQQWNIFNTGDCTQSVSSGDLILFPSSLFHAVSPTTKKDTRISLAFNVFAKGEIGEPSQLNSLIL
jgi:predicted 2-oxoglutarate/Fe(II)-dependent dioxygenase YbiX